MRISDWSSDVCSSDLDGVAGEALAVGTVATGFLVSVGVLDVRAGLQRLAVGRDLDPDRTAGDLQAFRRGLAGFHRHAVDELVRRTDAIGPDLDEVFAARDGVAGAALVIGAVAAGFLRSDERRCGKGGGRPCGTRGEPYYSKKN